MRKITITITPDADPNNCDECVIISNDGVSSIEVLDYLNTIMQGYSRYLLDEYKELTNTKDVSSKDLNDWLDHLRATDRLTNEQTKHDE